MSDGKTSKAAKQVVQVNLRVNKQRGILCVSLLTKNSLHNLGKLMLSPEAPIKHRSLLRNRAARGAEDVGQATVQYSGDV